MSCRDTYGCSGQAPGALGHCPLPYRLLPTRPRLCSLVTFLSCVLLWSGGGCLSEMPYHAHGNVVLGAPDGQRAPSMARSSCPTLGSLGVHCVGVWSLLPHCRPALCRRGGAHFPSVAPRATRIRSHWVLLRQACLRCVSPPYRALGCRATFTVKSG